MLAYAQLEKALFAENLCAEMKWQRKPLFEEVKKKRKEKELKPKIECSKEASKSKLLEEKVNRKKLGKMGFVGLIEK